MASKKQVFVGWVGAEVEEVVQWGEWGGGIRYLRMDDVLDTRGTKRDWQPPSDWPPRKVLITVEEV